MTFQTKNFNLINCDTDSITICKKDQSVFTKDEQVELLNELNKLFPEHINWEPDGYFDCIVVVKAKNYALWDGKTLKLKGSAFKDQKKEPALREFLEICVKDIVLNESVDNLIDIYHRYVKEILNVQDISRWCSKRTVTEKVLESNRTNETKLLDALSDTEFSEGDRFYVFFKEDGSLCLRERFNGEYCKDTLLEKIYKAAQTFSTIIENSKEVFLNYSLKKNKKHLEKFYV